MLCCLVWKRAMDMEVLDEAARITAWLIFGWLGLRLLDILFRGALGTAFHFDRFAGVFWLEMLLVSTRRLDALPVAAEPRNPNACSWATFSVRWAA